MSDFDELIRTADIAVLTEFADPLRWLPAGGVGVVLTGIIDLEAEFYGPDSDIPLKIRTVTVQSSAIPNHTQGDRLQMLGKDGKPTGAEYKLQRTLEDDGSLKVIEITK